MAEIATVNLGTPDQTVLLIPAFRLTAAVEQLRRRFDPTAVLGMPAHVTIMFPFLRPDEFRSPSLEALLDALASVHSFEYSLTEVRQFEQGDSLSSSGTIIAVRSTNHVGQRALRA